MPHWPESVRTWFYIVRVVTKIERRLEAHLTGYHLTPPQFEVLAQLVRTPGIVQQQLADRLFMSKGNAVGILNRLEQATLIQRQPHPEDGRAYQLYLTEQGRTLVMQVLPEHEAIIVDALAHIPAAERSLMHRVVRQLNRDLGSL